MIIAGVIAEYNPFHSGHKYQLEKTREAGATHIAAVMSGSFVQRGEVAVMTKQARAKTAILGGADLVIELPVPFAASAANRFAKAGVFLLNELCVDTLCFGSEAGDINALMDAAAASKVCADTAEMTAFLSSGLSYPSAMQQTLKLLYSEETAELFKTPNNALGIEYINAINELAPHIKPVTVKRFGTAHDSDIVQSSFASGSFASGSFASGSYLRELMKTPCAPLEMLDKIRKYIPEYTHEIYLNEFLEGRAPILQERLDMPMLYRLKTMTKKDFSVLPDVSEGLENRLFNAAGEARSMNEFYALAKTKRYTMARLRRICCFALLSLSKNEQVSLPQYIRVLGANEKGLEILSMVKASKKTVLPISQKPSLLERLAPTSTAAIDCFASDIAALAMPSPVSRGYDHRAKALIVR